MKYLLDANAVVALLKGNAGVVSKLTEREPSDFGLSSIVAHELFDGVFRREDARRAGELRALLAKTGKPIGSYDVLIAGQALARDLTVVTNNMREFARVPDLRVEDWQT